MSSHAAVAAGVLFFGLLTTMPTFPAPEQARQQVWAAELAFARTMADRKLQAFSEFVSDEAVFFSDATTLRGKTQVVDDWATLFETVEAPFSWEPDHVEVLASGTLALSTGPVRDTSGKIIARFNSVWRLEAPGVWRVVFDKGSPPSPGSK
jgi:ketosteroid isomerase-like protein